MANLLKDQIITNSKQLILFALNEIKPLIGRSDSIYYHIDSKISYSWNGTAYIQLSNTSTDLTIVDSFVNLPTTGIVDGLYITNETQNIYIWNVGTTSYKFEKPVMNIVTQSIIGVQVKYSSPAIIPQGLSLNTVYTIGYDSRTYLQLGNAKVYMETALIVVYFTPNDGRIWADIYGTYTPPNPSLIANTNEQKYIVDSLKYLFDTNNNGFVDYSEDSQKLNGKSGSYYLDYNNMSNKPNVDFTPINEKIGNITDLDTVDKTNLVGAVNELVSTQASNTQQITNQSRKQLPRSQYVKLSATNDVVQVGYKYRKYNRNDSRGGVDMCIEFGAILANNLIQIRKLSKFTNNNPYPESDFSKYTLFTTYATDLIGPLKVRANANGNANSSAFTGGCHGFDGGQTGSATARQVSMYVIADGRELVAGEECYAENISIVMNQRIQAYNTKQSDGLGREVLVQSVTYTFINGAMEIYVELIALENVTVELYYGLQSAWGNGTPYNDGTIHYVNGDSVTRKPIKSSDVLSNHNSGDKAIYPNPYMFCVRKGTDDVVCWLDRVLGLGTCANVSSTSPVIFSTDSGKTYFNLVNGIEKVITAGNLMAWHGGITFTQSLHHTSDLNVPMVRNNKLWNIISFLVTATEYDFTYPEDKFYIDLEDLLKDAVITSVGNNYGKRTFTSSGYGQYIYRIKK